MKKIITLILCAVMLLSFVSCDKEEKKKADLEKYSVIETEDFNITAATYAFFLYDTIGQYGDYLYYYGYDTSKTLTEQTGKCPFDEGKTWFEYFCSLTDSMLKECLAAASAALDSGLELTDAEIKEIDDYIKEMNDYAIQMGVSGVQGLLDKYYVEGISVSTFRQCIELQQLAYKYIDKVSSDLENGEYTEEQLVQYREAHPDEFLKVGYTHYSFFATFEKDATEDELKAAYALAKKEAEDFVKAHTTQQSFRDAIVAIENAGEADPYAPEIILYDYIEKGELYDSDKAEAEETKAFYEWAYSKDRKAGDTYVQEYEYANGEKYYTAYMIDTPVFFDNYVTKSIRHVLCYVDEDLKGDELTEAVNEAHKKANDLLAEFNAGEKTEAAFAELANKNSDDSDGTDGGLYKDVRLGYMVQELEDWIYDPARYVGETAIVATEYGYHIVYFVGNGDNTWISTAKAGVAEELYDEHMERLVSDANLTFDQESIKQIP